MMRRAGRVLALAPWVALGLLIAQPADAQRTAHERVAGCYSAEATPAAPWLGELEQRMRLTLEPVVSEPGFPLQFGVELLSGGHAEYPYLAWSLFDDGRVVSVTWTSATDQVGLVFEPDPGAPRSTTIGTTTFFTHETGMTTEPVDVRVTSIAC